MFYRNRRSVNDVARIWTQLSITHYATTRISSIFNRNSIYKTWNVEYRPGSRIVSGNNSDTLY